MGSKGQNATFSEHGHITYQIKRNQAMQQLSSNRFACRPIPPATLPTTLGDGVRVNYHYVACFIIVNVYC